MAPTSTPRVGWEAMNSDTTGLLSSRASTTFCWLPPDSDPAGSWTPVVRTSNSLTFSSALAAMTFGFIRTPAANGACRYWSRIMFSAIENGPTSPSCERSSGTNPMPESRICRVERPTSSSPWSVIEPVTKSCRPMIASVSSVCPLPCTPATQTTSPLRTSRSIPSTIAWPVCERTVRPLMASTTSLGAAASLCTFRLTARPTMAAASSVSDAVGSAVPTTLPRRITVIRSATALISRSLWLIITTDFPSAFNWRMISSSSSVSCGVSTAVGSSRIRTWAFLTRALMISTRCCTPTGRSSITASGSTSRL